MTKDCTSCKWEPTKHTGEPCVMIISVVKDNNGAWFYEKGVLVTLGSDQYVTIEDCNLWEAKG